MRNKRNMNTTKPKNTMVNGARENGTGRHTMCDNKISRRTYIDDWGIRQHRKMDEISHEYIENQNKETSVVQNSDTNSLKKPLREMIVSLTSY